MCVGKLDNNKSRRRSINAMQTMYESTALESTSKGCTECNDAMTDSPGMCHVRVARPHWQFMRGQ